jgi:hypothetical protein
MEHMLNPAAASAKRESLKTYDARILGSVAFVVVGLIVAAYALAAGPGSIPTEFVSAVVLP